MAENCAEAGPSTTVTTMSLREPEDLVESTVITDDRLTETEKHPITEETASVASDTTGRDAFPLVAETTYNDEGRTTAANQPFSERTPMPMSPNVLPEKVRAM